MNNSTTQALVRILVPGHVTKSTQMLGDVVIDQVRGTWAGGTLVGLSQPITSTAARCTPTSQDVTWVCFGFSRIQASRLDRSNSLLSVLNKPSLGQIPALQLSAGRRYPLDRVQAYLQPSPW